jgi:hypothetical protein
MNFNLLKIIRGAVSMAARMHSGCFGGGGGGSSATPLQLATPSAAQLAA